MAEWSNAQIQQLVTTLQGQVQGLNSTVQSQGTIINNLQAELTKTSKAQQVTATAVAIQGNSPSDTYITGDTIYHKLATIFQALVTFAAATFTGAVNLSSLTGSLPLQLDSSKNITVAKIALGGGTSVTGTLPVANGGLGIATVAAGDILIGAGTSPLDPVSLTAHNVVLGAGSAGVAFAAPSTAGFVLTDNGSGSDPSFKVPKVLYIGSETGANNVLVAAGPTIAAGQIIALQLAHTMQIGASGNNTLNYNGAGAINIMSHFDTSMKPVLGYAATGLLFIEWNGTVFLDLSQ